MLWMSDALAANTPKRHGERVVDLNCLVHARRQFVDIQDFFPSQCEHVITAIASVYRQEAQCTKAALSPTQRLAYHQAHSAPVMDAKRPFARRNSAMARFIGHLPRSRDRSGRSDRRLPF